MNNVFGVGGSRRSFGSREEVQGYRDLIDSTPFDQGMFGPQYSVNKFATTQLLPRQEHTETKINKKPGVKWGKTGETPGVMDPMTWAWIHNMAVTQLRGANGDWQTAWNIALGAAENQGMTIWETPPQPIYGWIPDPENKGAGQEYTVTTYSYPTRSRYVQPQTWRVPRRYPSAERRRPQPDSYEQLFER